MRPSKLRLPDNTEQTVSRPRRWPRRPRDQRAGVADAGGAPVADQAEPELLQVRGQPRPVVVVGDHPGAGRQRGLHPRLRDSPRSTAFLASSPAPIITEGLDVLVHEVMAAMTTCPWSIAPARRRGSPAPGPDGHARGRPCPARRAGRRSRFTIDRDRVAARETTRRTPRPAPPAGRPERAGPVASRSRAMPPPAGSGPGAVSVRRSTGSPWPGRGPRAGCRPARDPGRATAPVPWRRPRRDGPAASERPVRRR